MICERCQQEIQIGEWPFCPHGRGAGTNLTDEIPGGFAQENFGPEVEVFYSKRAMALRAKELGLIPFVRYSGPHDHHVPRWSTMDPYTLAAAESLVARMK